MGVKGKPLFFFEQDDGSHTHSDGTNVPVVAPVIEASDELTQPVIDHAEKITRIEMQQAQHQEDMMRQLGELESRLAQASASQVDSLRERILALEAKIEEAPPEAPIPESVELTLPEVEASPAPPEKMKQSLRARRKAKRKK